MSPWRNWNYFPQKVYIYIIHIQLSLNIWKIGLGQFLFAEIVFPLNNQKRRKKKNIWKHSSEKKKGGKKRKVCSVFYVSLLKRMKWEVLKRGTFSLLQDCHNGKAVWEIYSIAYLQINGRIQFLRLLFLNTEFYFKAYVHASLKYYQKNPLNTYNSFHLPAFCKN